MKNKKAVAKFLFNSFARRPGRGLAALSLLVAADFPRRADAANCDPPPSGLVGWWTGNGNALDSISTQQRHAPRRRH